MQFNALYEDSIDKSEKAALPSKRMANIMDHLTWEIYLYIQRGLFERHKLVFALILATKIWVSAGKVSGMSHVLLEPCELEDGAAMSAHHHYRCCTPAAWTSQTSGTVTTLPKMSDGAWSSAPNTIWQIAPNCQPHKGTTCASCHNRCTGLNTANVAG